ncbi:MAG: DNA repair protein RadC [Chloroflexi bacterium]|nr:DNA repair protein RadC [Chloroflexota bacterium]
MARARRIEDTEIEYHTTIPDLPAGERPRERLRDAGPAALSGAELLAILLRTGIRDENVLEMARRLLARFSGLEGLARAGFVELSSERGMGEAKTAQLKAGIELGRRVAGLQPEQRPVVRSPADLANLLMSEMGMLEQEQLRVALLNVRNHVLATPMVYQGSVHTSVVRVGEIFKEPVRQNAAAIIVVHNHPSGDPTPSGEDLRLTRELMQAGRLLDIEVLDHVVIGRGRFMSLKEAGLTG